MERFYYQVPAVLDQQESLTADVPTGVSWVGAPCGEGDCYLVLTLEQLPDLQPVSLDALPECCAANASTVGSWQIGGQ